MGIEAKPMHQHLLFLGNLGKALQVFVLFVSGLEDALAVDAAGDNVVYDVLQDKPGYASHKRTTENRVRHRRNSSPAKKQKEGRKKGLSL